MKTKIPIYNSCDESLVNNNNSKYRYNVTYFKMNYDNFKCGWDVTFYDRYGIELFKIFFDGGKNQYRYAYMISMGKINKPIISML